MKKIIILILLLTCIQTTYAQNLLNIETKKHRVYGRFGIEPTYVLALGYMRTFKSEGINRNLALFGEVSSPTKLFGINHYEVKLGGMMNLITHKKLAINYQLDFSTGRVDTKNFSSQKLAFSNTLFMGYFNQKRYFALTCAHEKIFANKIVHSEYYRNFIFPEAKDGWYKGAGGNVQIGIETGITLKARFDVQFEIKVPLSEQFKSYNGSPAHTSLTCAYRL